MHSEHTGFVFSNKHEGGYTYKSEKGKTMSRGTFLLSSKRLTSSQ